MLLVKIVIVAIISFLATSISLLVDVVVIVNVIVAVGIPILIILMLLIIMISLLFGLWCFAFASFPPAVDAVVDIVKVFVGEFVDAAETELLRCSHVSKQSQFKIYSILTATSSAISS